MKFIKRNGSYFTEDGSFEIYRTIYSGERSWKVIDHKRGETSLNGKGCYCATLHMAKNYVEFEMSCQ